MLKFKNERVQKKKFLPIKVIFFLLASLFYLPVVNAQLSGTYTIDPNGSGATNYTSFASAVSDLTSNGVSGAVIFEVADGTYNEQISIGAITGASSSNRITFISASEDSSKVILEYASSTSTTNNFVVKIDGADYVTIEQITIQRTGSSNYGRAIEIGAGSDSIILYRNRIIASAATTNTNYSAIYSAAGAVDGIKIIENFIKSGYYGIYFIGSAATPKQGAIIDGNIVDSFHYYGIYLTYNEGATISNNIVRNNRNTTTYSIYLSNISGQSLISKNHVTPRGTTTSYGIYSTSSSGPAQFLGNYIRLLGGTGYGLYHNDGGGSSTEQQVSANNMIVAENSGTTMGFYLNNMSYHSVVYNSVNVTAGSATAGRAFYATASSAKTGNEVFNNIFVNTGGGYAYEITADGITNTIVDTSDHNNIYATGATTVRIGTTDYADLSDWQTVTNWESNSLSVNPRFYSNTDLHVKAVALNEAATPLSYVTIDFDDDTRNSTAPDIGADEFDPPADDAGITMIVSPQKSFCSGTKDLIVRLRNFGTDTLKTVDITYLLDGLQQTSTTYNVSVPSGKDTDIVVGSVTVDSVAQHIVVYTSDPNGLADPDNDNDTARMSTRVGLNGNYTIGGSAGADFADFNAAVADLHAFGVCGAVTFDVEDGTYSEQVLINEIAGASATNRITFKSASGDSSKVILTDASSTNTTNNYTLELAGASYLTFKQITIARPGTNANARVVVLSGNASYNQFLNNQIISSINTSTNSAGIYSIAGTESYNEFSNNLIKYGYYGIYYFGSAAFLKQNNIITGNILDSFYSYGINLSYNENILVEKNRITNNRHTTTYGIHNINGSGASKFLGNYIHVGGTTAYLLYHTTGTGTSTDPQVSANNMLISDATSTTMGVYLNNVSHHRVVYNSVNITAGSATAGRAFYATASTSAKTGNQVFNNIFVNTGGGYAFDVTTGGVTNTIVDTSDHNNIYATGATTVRIGTTNYADLSDWQSVTNWESNSISVNPRFKSSTDLHTNAVLLNEAATPLSYVTTDFDNETRNSTAPDIGADEFTPPTDDAGISMLVSPKKADCAGTTDVVVRLRNYGIDKLNTVDITYLLDGVQQTSSTYSVSLESGKDTNIVVGSITLGDTARNIVVYTSEPNTNQDPTNSNDTLKASVTAGLGGTYTIGGSTNADYADFNSAITALDIYGVCSAVTFEIEDGTYSEKVVIKEISGASATNRITFKSASEDSSKVILTEASSTASADNYVLLFDAADFITFQQITIERTGSSNYGRAIEIGAGSDSIILYRNRIIASAATTSTLYSAIYSAAGAVDGIKIIENFIKSGYYGIYFIGSAATPKQGAIIEGNILDSFHYYGIYLTYNEGATISNNIVRNNRSTTTYSIYLANISGQSLISKNHVTPRGTTSSYGIYNTASSGPAHFLGNYIRLLGSAGYGLYHNDGGGSSTQQQVSANNMIVAENSGTTMGIYLNNVSNHKIVYNSVNVTAGSATAGRAFYATAATSAKTGNEVFNNIFVNTGGGYAYEITAGGVTNTIVDTSDHNNIYATGATTVRIGTTNYATLADWQKVSNWEANSLSNDPVFKSSIDLHSQSVFLNGEATPLSYVTTDYDGETRSSTAPDIGADEFTPPAKDITLIDIISPVTGCGDSFTTVAVVIQNFGTDGQSNFDVEVEITGAVTTTLTETYSSTLASKALDTIYFSTSINTYAGGTFNFTATTLLSGDEMPGNDAASKTIIINKVADEPSVTDVERCGAGEVTLKASGTSGEELYWYETNTSSAYIAMGEEYKSNFSETTTLYVAAKAQKSDNLTTTFAGGTSTFTGNYFDIEPSKNITVDSFAIHTAATGSITVEVYYKTGTYVSNETNSSAWTQLGSTTVTGNGSGNVTYINPGSLSLTANQVYGIFIVISSGGNIIYTTGGNTYTDNNLKLTTGAGINGVFSGSLVTPRSWNGSIFYTIAGCESPRVPVTVTIKDVPTGAEIAKGSTFNGAYKAGTATAPDSVCAGNTIVYNLTPPTGYANADFGTKWAVTDLSFETANGTGGADTILTIPSVNGNGSLSFTPVSSLADSTIIISMTITDLTTGCDTVLTRYMYVAPVPVADFLVRDACDGNEVSIMDNAKAGTGFLTYLYRLGDGSISMDQSPTYTYSQTGMYNITQVVVSGAGCIDSISKPVTIFASPVASFSVDNTCNDSVVSFNNSSTITNGILTYTWNFGDGNTSTLQNPAHTYAAAGTYEVKLVVTSNNGCNDSTIMPVTIYPAPVAEFDNPADICFGDLVEFINTSTVPAGTLSYVWDFGDGNTSTDENPQHLYAQSGLYNIRLIATSIFGCVDTFYNLVSVNKIPVPEFEAAPVCVGNATTFINTSQDSADGLTFVWNFGDGNSSTDKNPLHVYGMAGTYSVNLTVTSLYGCTNSINQDITVYENPVAAFDVTNTCAGSMLAFTNTSNTLADTTARYIWYFGDGDTTTVTNPMHTFAIAGNYKVILAVINTNNCIDTVSQVITIYDVPVAGFTATEVCAGNTTDFTDTSTVANGTIVSRLWYFGNGDTSTQAMPQVIYATAGNYTVSLVVTSENGCKDSTAMPVIVHALPNAAFTSITDQKSATFTPANATHANYTWSFGDGDSSMQTAPTHTYAGNGTYMVTLIVTSDAGCTSVFTDSVVINSIGMAPVADANFALNLFPNPFRDNLSMTYELQNTARVHIAIHDITGKQIVTLVDARQANGKYTQTIDANAHHMQAGTYFVRVNIDGVPVTKKVIRVK